MKNDTYIIVIGASAGGLSALKNVISPLPADFPAAIFIVLHTQATTVSHLPKILNRYSEIPALHPKDGQVITSGHIYVAPPDRHMILFKDTICLRDGPKINFCRPAIDPLFYSAAQYGTSTIGILLSGMLKDGSAGLLAIKKNQGITIVQDLNEAEFQDMPKNAVQTIPIDYCLPSKDISALLLSIVRHKKT